MSLQLKQELKRRLVAEKLVYEKFNNFTECAIKCDELAQQRGIDATFNRLSIQQFICCTSNLSIKRLSILAEVLGTDNFKLLNEVYTFPKIRGIGGDIIGSEGNIIKDLDMRVVEQLVG